MDGVFPVHVLDEEGEYMLEYHRAFMYELGAMLAMERSNLIKTRQINQTITPIVAQVRFWPFLVMFNHH